MKQIKRKLLSLLLAMAMVCTLVPSALAAVTATLTASPDTIKVGGSSTLTMAIQGAEADASYSVEWEVTSGEGVVRLDHQITNGSTNETNSVTGLKVGTAIISAKATKETSDGSSSSEQPITKTVNVTVSANDITLTPSSLNMAVGQTQQLTVSPTGTNITGWASSDSTVATVANGLVTAVKAGTATITASTADGKSATCAITVTGAGLTASTSGTTVAVGGSTSFSVGVTGVTNLSGYTVEFSTTSTAFTLNNTNSSAGASSTAIATATSSTPVYIFGGSAAASAATVTAQLYNGRTAVGSPVTFTVTVTANTTNYLSLASSQSIAPTPGTGTLTASVSGLSNMTGYHVEWTSSNTNVIRVGSASTTGTTTSYFSTNSSTSTAMGIYAVASTGYADITAVLKNSAGVEFGTRTCRVTISNSGGYTLRLAPSGTSSFGSSVPVNYNYGTDYPYYDSSYYYGWRDFTVVPVLYYGNTQVSSGYSVSNVRYNWTLRNTTLYTYSTSGRGLSSYYSTSTSGNTSSTARIYASDLYNYTSTYTANLTCTLEATVTIGGQSFSLSTSTSPSHHAYWTVYPGTYYNSSFTVSATVYQGETYYLNTTNSETSTSVIDQIDNHIRNYYYNYNYNYGYTGRYLSSVSFSTTSSNGSTITNSSSLSGAYFTPTSSNLTSNSTASFSFTAYDQYSNPYYGTLNVTVKPGTSAGGSISLTGAAGENVSLSASDFTTWWRNMFTNGSLSYVTFTSISTGSLNNNGTSVVSASNPTRCYVSPSGSQAGLSNLVYVPSSRSTSTVTIRFTGYGSSTSTSSTSTSRTGTLTITYVVNAGTPITYSITGGSTSVSLNPSDFTAKYREVIGSTATNVNVRFRSVPTYGTLRYGSTTLTSSNISSYTFTTNSSGSARLADVVYTPSAAGGSDTVEFACYSGSTLRFVGTIVFSATAAAPQNVTVSYTSNGGAVAFNYTDFYYSNAAVQASTYITFGTPSSGSLTVNGSAVTSSDRFTFANTAGYQYINNVTYRPASGYTGTVTIPFAAYNSNNTVAANGNVSITVTQPAAPAVTFKDMGSKTSSNQWYFDQVNSLVQRGIIGGYDDGTFRPNANVTYGEALKLILLAAGHPEQTQGSGANWAVNYMNYAVSNGFLDSSASGKLSEAMDRNTIAAVTAKAMGLTPVTSGTSPFVDSNDPYVLALHQAGIIAGNSSSGATYFEGSKNLTRAEISLIIYRMCDQQ